LKILSAKYIVTFDDELNILKNKAIAYDKKIKMIASKKELLKKFPDAKLKEYDGNFVLLPGLINTHIHLEYLANKTSLEYGEFVKWLKTVLKHQQTLINKCSDESISEVLNKLLKSGTTTVGEISSFGFDINASKASKINVVLFNEILGSSLEGVDMMYQNFLQRYQTSLLLQDDRFIPAISVHSPYSTHPILAKKVLQIAREDKKVVATHFMESRAEREWLEGGKGEFKEFLRTFNPYAKPLIEPLEYLKLFYGVDTLFVHTTFANDKELEYINNHDYSIASCPVSNRVLENAKLDISKVKNLTIATDGLTSNISLNLWDELRASLFIHENIDIDELSKKLLTSVTKNSAKALKLNKGVLKNGYDADIIVVELPDDFEELESIYKWLILHTKEAKETIIQGENI